MIETRMATSHVFVIRGDLLHLECDAWLLPTDTEPHVRAHWADGNERRRSKLSSAKTPIFLEGKVLALEVADWPPNEPLPILTAIPTAGVQSVTDLVPAVEAFIALGAELAVERRSVQLSCLRSNDPAAELPRPRPLLAMPLLGTGGGGANLFRGDVLKTIMASARVAAAESNVDVVLVLKDERDFALAQMIRKQSPDRFWPALEPQLQSEAQVLADKAEQAILVPFLGAGTSISAGAPSWEALINQLASEVGLTADEIAKLKSLDVLDQAAYLRELYADEKVDFGKAIEKLVNLPRYGLAPILLASLPAKEAITLNYDQLFEVASADAGHRLNVIPGTNPGDSTRWLLKLHGSVDDPNNIVLTREDYLGYNTSREALSAMVKATLITRHLLFVGFGLADDHFHAIVHDVQRALPHDQESPTDLGTALTLFDDPLQTRLWKGKLRLIPMSHGSSTIPEAARSLEIFLDVLLAYSTNSHTYLLSREFEDALSEDEKRLAKKLKLFINSVTPEERCSPAWPYLESALKTVGWSSPLPTSQK